jgi:UDP-N-acetylglucosamine 2-epimerase (non-hydrolysing)
VEPWRDGGSMSRVVSVVGARPNFMKLAPVERALASRPPVEHVIVHTGQHYDTEMSEGFFRDLDIPEPHHHLEVGSASHAQQTAAIMQRFERVCLEVRPDAVLVYGDVNSTVAAALVAAKLGIRIGHVEAGLRSRDWSMPEEINRVVTDRLADWLFTPSPDADANLLAEGVPPERIHLVGNVMIDSLVHAAPRARALAAASRHGLANGEYVLVTLHRPSNVDERDRLGELMGALEAVAAQHPVLFPVHPRTRQRLEAFGIRVHEDRGMRMVEPLGYLEMLGLVSTAGLVITDSGGLQEETSYLGVPCLTVRANTERPITLTAGTNRLVPSTRAGIVDGVEAAWGTGVDGCRIDKWDGRTAERIADVLVAELMT